MQEQKLIKLKITAYRTHNFLDNDKVDSSLFVVQVNPEMYTLAFPMEIANEKNQPEGTSAFPNPWSKNPPQVLNLEFLMDSTGSIASTANNAGDMMQSVRKQIESFKKTAYYIKGERHEPYFLLIQWGTFCFRCRMTNMTINYKLFSPGGDPIRATINASFKGVVSPFEMERGANQKSPDVTHYRAINEGDRLPIMCKNIYGNEALYLAVAMTNKWVEFRNPRPGTPVTFLPLNKSNE